MNWTRRQHEAFWQYRYALERVLLVKSTPVQNGEEARMRWYRLTDAQTKLRHAQETLDASIIDAFDATGRGISSEAPHTPEGVERDTPPTPWPGSSPNKRNDDDCTCLSATGALCPKCHAGYGR